MSDEDQIAGPIEDPIAAECRALGIFGPTVASQARPETKKPPQYLIQAAMIELARVLHDFGVIIPNGEHSLSYVECRERLTYLNHSISAVEWAIQELNSDGRLLIDEEGGKFEWLIRFVGRTLGPGINPGETTKEHVSKMIDALRRHGPAPADAFRVVSTPTLWNWWSAQDQPGKARKPRGRSPIPTIAKRNQIIRELCRKNDLFGKWAKLARMANSDPRIIKLNLSRPLTRGAVRKVVEPGGTKKRVGKSRS